MSGFDLDDIYTAHGFLVVVPRTQLDPVKVFEVFGEPPTREERELKPETLLRAEVARERWNLISPELRNEMNRRLKAESRKSGRFSIGDNPVQRLLGKELLVLAWAVEMPDVSADECAVAVSNWLGLKPEERWWLYTMTAAATGYAHQVGLGWRGALRQALCFGSGPDRFGLGAMTTRGQLPARPNPGYEVPRRDENAKPGAHAINGADA